MPYSPRYQINCLPFVVLKNQGTSLYIVSKNKPSSLFNSNLWHDLTLGKAKFAAKSLKCLFPDTLGGREVTIAIFLNTYIF